MGRLPPREGGAKRNAAPHLRSGAVIDVLVPPSTTPPRCRGQGHLSGAASPCGGRGIFDAIPGVVTSHLGQLRRRSPGPASRPSRLRADPPGGPRDNTMPGRRRGCTPVGGCGPRARPRIGCAGSDTVASLRAEEPHRVQGRAGLFLCRRFTGSARRVRALSVQEPTGSPPLRPVHVGTRPPSTRGHTPARSPAPDSPRAAPAREPAVLPGRPHRTTVAAVKPRGDAPSPAPTVLQHLRSAQLPDLLLHLQDTPTARQHHSAARDDRGLTLHRFHPRHRPLRRKRGQGPAASRTPAPPASEQSRPA